jgi:hypothetical protein
LHDQRLYVNAHNGIVTCRAAQKKGNAVEIPLNSKKAQNRVYRRILRKKSTAAACGDACSLFFYLLSAIFVV